MRLPRRLIIFTLSFFVIALFSWAFFQPTFFRVHDYTHVARLVEMKRALDAGHFPVQWTQNFGYGYGMPLFLFYGPLPSYVGSILLALGLSPVWAMKVLFFGAGLLAFSGMFQLLRRWGYLPAMVGASLLLAAPYRAVDVFVRGALNEAIAIGILPWILQSLFLIPEKRRTGVASLAFWTAALLLTHNLTALMFLPVAGVIALTLVLRQPRKQFFPLLFSIATGFGLGIGLAAFSIIPAFLEKDSTIIQSILSGYFDFRLHFLYIRQFIWPHWGYGGSNFGPDDGMSFHLGFPLLFLLLLTAGWMIHRRWHAARLSWQKNPSLWLSLKKSIHSTSDKEWFISVFVTLATIALFLTLNRAWSIWESAPLLSFIQFPWRFLAVAIVLLSAAAGMGLSILPTQRLRATAALVVVIGTFLGQWQFHRPESFLKNDDDFYYNDPERIRTNMSDILPDYLPQGFDRDLPPVEPESRIVFSGETENGLRYELNRPQEILIETNAPQGGTVTWNIADFPGWKYFVNDADVQTDSLPDGRRTYITDKPITSLGAQFSSTPLRSLALGISALSLIIWGALALPFRKTSHEK